SRNSRPSTQLLNVLCSWLSGLSHLGQVGEEFAPFLHLPDGSALVGKGAGRADLDALAATGAGFGIAPRLVEIGDDPRMGAAAHDIPGVGSFDFVANPDAPGAED